MGVGMTIVKRPRPMMMRSHIEPKYCCILVPICPLGAREVRGGRDRPGPPRAGVLCLRRPHAVDLVDLHTAAGVGLLGSRDNPKVDPHAISSHDHASDLARLGEPTRACLVPLHKASAAGVDLGARCANLFRRHLPGHVAPQSAPEGAEVAKERTTRSRYPNYTRWNATRKAIRPGFCPESAERNLQILGDLA